MNYRYKYKLNELDCADCARKIEEKLNDNQNINKARVDFNRLTITLDTNLDKNVKKLVNEIVISVEPNTKVLDINENNKSTIIRYDLICLFLGLILMVFAYFIKNDLISKIFIIFAYIILLHKTFIIAIKMLLKGNINENLLITISCIGAYLTNNINEGLMVIILYEIGKILEKIAINNSRKSISDLMNIKPEYANLKINNDIVKKDPEDININDIIVVKSGEKIPLDGVVIKGNALIDTSSLTGESEKRFVKKKDLIYSGTINTEGLIEIKVLKKYSDSTVANILELVENSSNRKAKAENFVTKYAKIYTPIIIILAILIVIFFPIMFNITLNDAIYRGLVFLVVSCPCAIAISVPLSYFSGIGFSSKEGILIKGSDYLDASSNIKEIIFDKTGTITNGNFNNYELQILNENYQKEEIIKYICLGEQFSNHPIAKSILNVYNKKYTDKINNFKEKTGKGISYQLNNQNIKIGSAKYCNNLNIEEGIFLSIDNEVVAKLIINDDIKDDAKTTIESLKHQGIIVKMFTGDSKEKALTIGKKIGIEEVNYELMPKDKYNLLEKELKKYDGNVCFVGDGINDAPTLAIAKIGIAMGGIGSDAAIEAADIVIMNDKLNSILKLINISKKTKKIINQNLVFALSVKIIVLILSSLGMASMWQAVFADTGVTLLTILNTTRILRKKI